MRLPGNLKPKFICINYILRSCLSTSIYFSYSRHHIPAIRRHWSQLLDIFRRPPGANGEAVVIPCIATKPWDSGADAREQTVFLRQRWRRREGTPREDHTQILISTTILNSFVQLQISITTLQRLTMNNRKETTKINCDIITCVCVCNSNFVIRTVYLLLEKKILYCPIALEWKFML